MSSSPDVAVLFALRRESAPFLALLKERATLPASPCPAWLGHKTGILVMETGVGATRTRRALDWLAQTFAGGRDFSRIIAAGFCGALDPSLNVGAVVQASEVVDGQHARFAAEPILVDAPAVRLVTVETLVSEPSEKDRLRASFGAQAVDMESAHVARFCTEAGVPFQCLRAVSDDAASRLSPHLMRLLSGGRVAPGRLAATLLCRPWLIPQLWQLGRATRLASRELARVLRQSVLGSEPSQSGPSIA